MTVQTEAPRHVLYRWEEGGVDPDGGDSFEIAE